MANTLERLNPRQREAVLHADGPLLILAGAGSGKTSTMAHRIANLISVRNVAPENVLGLSFTNKAARELRERVKSLLAKSSLKKDRDARGLIVTTFHSLCVRMLRAHAARLGFQPGFTIVDRSDQKDILKDAFRNIRVDDRKFDLDVLLFEIGQAKGRFLAGEAAQEYFLANRRLGQDYGVAAATVFPRYQDQLKALNAMDFDDLLFQGVNLLEKHLDVREHYNATFRHILVNEYQDTNPTQFRLLGLLTMKTQNLCVVGDDDQSIYSWRGADPAHILEFGRHFPAARTITLDQNYRSTSTILEAANHVIRNNLKRHPKALWSDRGSGSAILEVIVEEDRQEAEFVATELFRRKHDENRSWKEFAVLYRSNAQSRVFEEAFRRHCIPYKIVGGYSFLDLKEVKDVLSYLRLICNPRDDASLRRILNWPARGIGKSSIEAVGNAAFQKELPFFEALALAPQLAPRSADSIGAFHRLILELRAGLEAAPCDPVAVVAWARGALERIGAKKAIEAEQDDPAQGARRWENIEEVMHGLGQTKAEETSPGDRSPSVAFVQDYLGRMALDAQEEEGDRNSKDEKDRSSADEATLLTLHGAKGLEFPVVFLVGLEEGLIPHKRVMEEGTDYSEERRLCYVGITRARDHLILLRARKRIRFGKPVPRLPSRFLQEIPVSTLIRRDESHGPDASDSDEAREAHEEKVKGFLSGIRAMLDGNTS